MFVGFLESVLLERLSFHNEDGFVNHLHFALGYLPCS